MKKTVFISLAIVLTVLMSIGVSFALTGNDGEKLNGPHYQFNMIGHPNSISGDYSNGNTIMVPLETEYNLIIDGYTPPECPDDYPDPNDAMVDEPTPVGKTKNQLIKFLDNDLANKVKIYFNDDDMCDGVTGFEIVDRDATDLRADICLPTESDGTMLYDVYVRILGKPNKCLDINGLVYYDGSGYEDAGWYWAGSVFLARKGGKSIFINANQLFDIEWCTNWNLTTGLCTASQEYSVFSNLFDGYMWQINNHGARNVQVRLYPVEEE